MQSSLWSRTRPGSGEARRLQRLGKIHARLPGARARTALRSPSRFPCAFCLIPFPVSCLRPPCPKASATRKRRLSRAIRNPGAKSVKTRIYNNLKSFFEKQSRFATDVHDFSEVFGGHRRLLRAARHSPRTVKVLFRRPFPRGLPAIIRLGLMGLVASLIPPRVFLLPRHSPRACHGPPSRHRSPRDPRMGRLARRRARDRGTRSSAFHPRAARRQGAPLRGLPSLQRQHRLPQHDPSAPGGTHARRPGPRAPAALDGAMERRGDGPAGGRKDLELGGHIASFASAATLYDVGFNHFWHAPERGPRRRPGLLPGPLVARHLRARVPRRAAHRRAAATTSARKSTARASRRIRTRG